jgi:CRISPR type IV-associated protein Csf3
MKPLIISCTLISGVACDGFLPLDAILAHSWMRENHPDLLWQDSVAAKSNLVEADLPLKRLGAENDWFWACSFCDVEWQEAEISYWHKRNTIYEQTRWLKTSAGKVDVGKGPTKAYRMPLYRLHANAQLKWYAVGDAEKIKKLLLHVSTIGKKRGQGNGGVVDWQIETAEDDWSVEKDGRLMRAIPMSFFQKSIRTFEKGAYGLRPPYWHLANKRDSMLLPVLRGIT